MLLIVVDFNANVEKTEASLIIQRRKMNQNQSSTEEDK